MSAQLFSTGQVAKMLGASVEAVNYWIRQGKLKAYRTPGGHYRVAAPDLVSFTDAAGSWLDPQARLGAVPHILVVDDEEHMRNFVKKALDEEYEVSTAGGGLEGCLVFGDVKPDILIVDVKMPDISGREVVRVIRENNPQPLRVIVMTAYPFDTDAEQLKLMDIDGFLQKPFDLDELKRLIYSLEDSEDGPLYKPSEPM